MVGVGGASLSWWYLVMRPWRVVSWDVMMVEEEEEEEEEEGSGAAGGADM